MEVNQRFRIRELRKNVFLKELVEIVKLTYGARAARQTVAARATRPKVLAFEPRAGCLRVKFKRALVLNNGFLDLAHLEQNSGKLFMGTPGFRIELDSPSEGCFGEDLFTAAHEPASVLAMGMKPVRPQRRRSLQVVLRGLEVDGIKRAVRRRRSDVVRF